MLITVLDATGERERRVALTPSGVADLIADGHEVTVEAGAGAGSGFSDADYTDVGAAIGTGDQGNGRPRLVLTLGPPFGATFGPDDAVIGMLDPRWRPDPIAELAAGGATLIALELMPRITRAQSMDVLSSMATVAGTEAVLLAAVRLPKLFPLMMTAAGTIPPARVLVLGAGVAGLQAIATARRLGAVVTGYDVRPAASEQIRSLGATALEFDLGEQAAESDDLEDAGGYARAQSDDTADRQRAALAPHVAGADVVITTAAVPGAASPLLITTSMVEAMTTGSVVVDMAAERGGNCELTVADKEISHEGVLVLGPTDLVSAAPHSASQMYSTNLVTLVRHLDEEGRLRLDPNDEITGAIVIARDGELLTPTPTTES